jgi:hypothetical protein
MEKVVCIEYWVLTQYPILNTQYAILAPMRILFTRFPLESAFGGAEIQTLSLMEGLMKRGHAAAFLGSCPALLEECHKRGLISAELLIGKPPVTKWNAISFAWRKHAMKKKLEAAINEFGTLDVICMLSLSEKLLLTDAATEKGIKVIWIEHDRVGRWLSKNPWLPMLIKQSKRVMTVPVSHLSGKLYEQLGWDAATIKPIADGIDTERVMVSPEPALSGAEGNHDTRRVALRRAQGDTLATLPMPSPPSPAYQSRGSRLHGESSLLHRPFPLP